MLRTERPSIRMMFSGRAWPNMLASLRLPISLSNGKMSLTPVLAHRARLRVRSLLGCCRPPRHASHLAPRGSLIQRRASIPRTAPSVAVPCSIPCHARSNSLRATPSLLHAVYCPTRVGVLLGCRRSCRRSPPEGCDRCRSSCRDARP
jgi:hypothetical protein